MAGGHLHEVLQTPMLLEKNGIAVCKMLCFSVTAVSGIIMMALTSDTHPCTSNTGTSTTAA